MRILAQCDRDSLVILDELGAGTDPVEGSALARAILEHLREKCVTTFVATHYSELKSYAHHTPGVVNASVEFDAETLAPAYRLTIGLPGRSNAFAIARRLGLDARIVEGAQAMVAPDVQRAEAMLQDIQAALDAARHEHVAAETLRARLESRHNELNQRLARIDHERSDILNETRAQARLEIESVRQELRHLRDQRPGRPPWAPASDTPPEQGALDHAAGALDALEAGTREEVTPVAAPVYRGPLQPGDMVWVVPLHASGDVIACHRGQVEVQVGRFRTTVRRNQVELRERLVRPTRGDAAERLPTVVPSSPKRGVCKGVAVVGSTMAGRSPGMELDLRGQTSDEGLINLERYLDDAAMANLPWVRIIHGKGSGVLRAAVRAALKSHSLVTSDRTGGEGEGGDGVTVINLAVD